MYGLVSQSTDNFNSLNYKPMKTNLIGFYSQAMNYSIGTTYEGKHFDYLKEIIPYVHHIEVSPDSITVKKERTS